MTQKKRKVTPKGHFEIDASENESNLNRSLRKICRFEKGTHRIISHFEIRHFENKFGLENWSLRKKVTLGHFQIDYFENRSFRTLVTSKKGHLENFSFRKKVTSRMGHFKIDNFEMGHFEYEVILKSITSRISHQKIRHFRKKIILKISQFEKRVISKMGHFENFLLLRRLQFVMNSLLISSMDLFKFISPLNIMKALKSWIEIFERSTGD